MARSRHRGAFVVGSIVGGAAGAIAALWKTPQSGVDFRRKLGFESDAAHSVTSAAQQAAHSVASGAQQAVHSAAHAAQATKPLPAKALGLVEQVTAPLVGVKLGQTANNSQPGQPSHAASNVRIDAPAGTGSVMPHGSK